MSIRKPSLHGDEYINRKGFASINVQATCNGRNIFTSVDASWPGSVHDSRIWRNSRIFQNIRRQEDIVLLADEGYGITPWLMVPFRNPTTPEERSFNNCHTKERVIIERCFGQVKQRFPILQNKIRLSTERVPKVIICCFVLHNIAKHLQDDDDVFEVAVDNNVFVLNDADEEAQDRLRRLGQEKRIRIARIVHAQNVQEVRKNFYGGKFLLYILKLKPIL